MIIYLEIYISHQHLILNYYLKLIKKDTTHCGQVHSSDQFYSEMDPKVFENLQKYGVLCVEMESYGLFTLARKYGKKALAIFTISDSLVSKEADSAENRQNAYTQMMKLALEVAPE